MGKKGKGRPLSNLVVISDPHIGCRLGLCPPEPVPLDDGGSYEASRLQKIVWGHWEEFWGEWVPQVTRGDPFGVCLNGDALEGKHHGAETQISQNKTDQARLAHRILKPVVEACEGRYYHIRGTEAHAGQSGQEEERLAEQLGAIPDEEGRYARWELWIRLGIGLVHLTHHIGTAGSLAYETTAIQKELEQAFVEAGRWRDEIPDVVIRSHRHRNAETRVQTYKGFATSCTTAGWQLKMLALDTPLPTPSGWTTMGDVKVGDTLFDDHGALCTVQAAHPINLSPESFEVRFSNGEVVKACADHLWLTTAFVGKPGVPGHGGEKRPRKRVRTTKELRDTLLYGKNKTHNHKLTMPLPLQIPDRSLPVDPYVLGCWLGDGDSDMARLSCCDEDAEHYKEEFRRVGYALSRQSTLAGKCPRFAIRTYSCDGVTTVAKNDPKNLQYILREMGLIQNKHVPQPYLRGSFPQRLSLLQGLMDTDGHPDHLGRSCFFTTTRHSLRNGVVELLATLGIKYTCSEQPSKLNGKIMGTHWCFRFFMSPDIMPIFRLTRKLSRVPLASSRKTAQKSRVVHIVAVEPCDPVPMRCIAVDSPSHLYRFGRTMLYTHNTPLVYRVAGARQTQPQIGGTLVRAGDEDVYTRHKLWKISRSKEERPTV